MPSHYQRHFPPITNRLVFGPERTPSLENISTITNRALFRMEIDHGNGSDSRKTFDATEDKKTGSGEPFKEDTTHMTVIHAPTPPKQRGDVRCSAEAVSGLRRHHQLPDAPANDSAAMEVLYPRPAGSLSKPNSGGYSLREALGWSDDLYMSVQVSIPL